MNKLFLNAVLVVEGISDVGFISSFIDAFFFTTNGCDLSNEKLDLLVRISNVRPIILLTDPDKAGLSIQKRIVSEIEGVSVANISGLSRKNYKKHGVAEATKEEIIHVLTPFSVKDSVPLRKANYNLISKLSLAKNPSELKSNLILQYRLIPGNLKSISNQLNMLGISEAEIDKICIGK